MRRRSGRASGQRLYGVGNLLTAGGPVGPEFQQPVDDFGGHAPAEHGLAGGVGGQVDEAERLADGLGEDRHLLGVR